MSDRIAELENIAEECENAAAEINDPDLEAALFATALYFRSRARILAKVRGEKE